MEGGGPSIGVSSALPVVRQRALRVARLSPEAAFARVQAWTANSMPKRRKQRERPLTPEEAYEEALALTQNDMPKRRPNRSNPDR